MHKNKLIALVLSAGMILGTVGCGDAASTETVTTGTEAHSEEDSTAPVDTGSEGDSEAGDISTDTNSGTTTLVGTGPAKPEDFVNAEASDEYAINDGDKIIDINFDDNDLHGFGQYKNGGSFNLLVKDGVMVSEIESVGVVDHADQIFVDGFSLSQGCIYRLSFDISSDVNRTVEYRLQLNGGDYHAYQGEYIDVTPEMQNISVEFEMTEESDPAPRFCFNMGKTQGMDQDPGKHNIYIDNILLEVVDSSNADAVSGIPGYTNVAVNQIGYKPADRKYVVVKSDSEEEKEFIICDAGTNETVYMGYLDAPKHDSGSYLDVRQGEFTDFSTPGEYYIVTEEGASYKFAINDAPFDDIYKDTVLMLYRQRCGMAIEGAAAGNADHGECHMEEAVVFDNESVKKDVTGGWHDAGDYGRYVVSGAETVADLMLAYRDYNIDDDDLGIPESGNGIPDILDEARYELDWMLKMQDEESGGVYHKVTGLVFPETVKPEEETETMYLMPISATATADFAAVMAMASVIYKDIDPEFTEKAYAAAEKAWDYVKDIDDKRGFKNPKGVSTGEYPDGKIWDEKYWAAAELYLAGRDDLEGTVNSYLQSENIEYGLGWADMASYADYDLAISDKASMSSNAAAELKKDADEILEKMEKSGYFNGVGTKYPWGSNMTVANHAQLLEMTYNVTQDNIYKEYARKQLDYLFGVNAMGYCFVTGYGTFYPEHPHHRPSELADELIPGMLVGGPDVNLEDPYAKTVLEGQSPAMCYVDNAQSYSTNEVAIYWNSPLIYVISAEK